MTDTFKNEPVDLDSPGTSHFAITPNDTTDLALRPRCLYVGVAGDIVIRMGGVDITYKNVSGVLPVRAERVLAASTTALNIIGWV